MFTFSNLPNENQVNNFSIIKFNYSDKDKELLKNLNVISSENLRLYSIPSLKTLETFYSETLMNNSNEIKSISKLTLSLIKEAVSTLKQESALIDLRVTTTTFDEWEIPRWHTDSYNFNNKIKFTTTLLGPSTLIYPNDKNLKNILQKAKSDKINTDGLSFRKTFSKKFKKNLITQVDNHHGIFYLTSADRNIATFHSEPFSLESRIFLGVLPASKKELKDYQKFLSQFN
jgi:hypothetical protein